jgi:hypothetical protein
MNVRKSGRLKWITQNVDLATIADLKEIEGKDRIQITMDPNAEADTTEDRLSQMEPGSDQSKALSN